MLISDLLRAKGDLVVTIEPRATVGQLLRALAEHNVGALVVSTDGRHVDGIVSERDVVRHLHRRGPELLDAPVAEIMTSTVHTCTRHDTVDGLMATMTRERVRHVPVLEDGALVGIVSIGDVVKSRLGELESERDDLVRYITIGG
jgi:CBS domain-containing protein